MYTSTALYPSLPPLHRGRGYRDSSSSLIRSSTYSSDYGGGSGSRGTAGVAASSNRFREAFTAAKKQYGPFPGGGPSQRPYLRSMSMSPSRTGGYSTHPPDVVPVRQLIRESFDNSQPRSGRGGSAAAMRLRYLTSVD
jgi:hypothetical protein